MNATHDPKLRSWVESANDPACDFPIQNLPFGIFRKKGGKERPRGGVAIGDQILDLAAVGLNTGPTLNVLAATGRPAWKAIRKLLSDVLSNPQHRKKFSKHLMQQTPFQCAEHQILAGPGELPPGREAKVDQGDLYLRLPGAEPGSAFERAVELEIHVV